jgi:hypothetical protein
VHGSTVVRALSRAACACASLVAVAAAGDGPMRRAEALELARKAVAEARTAERGKKEAKEALAAAIEPLRHHADPERGDLGAYGVWNDVLQVGAWHGARIPTDLRLTEHKAGGLRVSVPQSRRWKVLGREGDQLAAKIVQAGPGDKPLRTIKFWTYRFDTVYVGAREIGGENAKGLAESDLESDRWVSGKVRKRSTRVTKQRLNAEVREANFYEIHHLDVDLEEDVHRRNWYFKGTNRTYNLEVIAHLGALDAPRVDPFLRWELEDGGPEVKAFLASVAETGD